MPCSLAILPISAIGLIGVHDGDQDRFRRNCRFQIVQADAAIALHWQIGHFKAVLLEVFAGIQHRFVLDGLGDDVIALFAEHLRDALDHQVVGFRGAAGEDDFLRRGVDQRSDLLARGFDGLFAGPAERVIAARSVAEFLGEIRQHRFDDARIHRRSRVIVHVNRQFDSHIPSSLKTNSCATAKRTTARRARARAGLRSSEKSSRHSKHSEYFR